MRRLMNMYDSVTQFIWKEALGMPALEAPEPTNKKNTKYGSDERCWLCGGDTENLGWHKKDVITSSFTDVDSAKASISETCCYSCAATMKQEGWQVACEKYGHPWHFPIKEGKKPASSNWMFSSHVIAKDHWQMPARSDFREILTNPPKTPFVITLADAGKKHVLFRASVNYSQDHYSVMLDDEEIFIDRKIFTEMLARFEGAYTAGFSKASLLSGEYNQAAIMKIGIRKWREIEDVMRVYRDNHYDMMRIVALIGQKQEGANE